MRSNQVEVRHLATDALCKAIIVSTLLFFCCGRAFAQGTTDGSTPLGIAPGSPTGSYPLSDIETVNLFNGSLNFRLPLLKVGGRGGAGYPITLHIEQKWTVHKEKLEPSYPYTYWAEPGWWSEEGGGWRTFDVGRVHVRRGKSEQFDLRCGLYLPRETLTRLTFSAPDGTEYELRDQLTNGQPVWPVCGGGFNRGRVFVTSDGSSATFISDTDIIDIYDYMDDSEVYPSGYMLLRDGTRFRVENAKIVWMRDRNGNKVAFTHDPYKRVTSVVDSLGRQVTITYATSSVPYTEISFSGFAGAPRSLKIGQANLGSVLRSGYTIQSPRQLFPELSGSSSLAHDPAVISYVEMPDGRRYQFQYNNYAELARLVLPTGGAIEYDYAAGLTDGAASGVFGIGSDKFVYRRVTERRVYPNGGSGGAFQSKTTYSRPETTTTNAGHVVVDQVGANGALLARTRHFFHGSARDSFGQKPTKYPAYKDGREYRTETLDADGATPLRVVEQTYAQRAQVTWWAGDPELAPPNDPRVTQTLTTLADTNQVSKQTFAYDAFNNTTDLWEYDFGAGAPPSYPLRHTHTDYLTVNNGIDYTSHNGPHIRGLVRAQQVYSVNPQTGAETLATQTETRYDEPSYPPLAYGTVVGWDDPGTTARGMATTTRRWLDTNNTWIETHVQYDQLGNVRKAWDARGNLSQVEYDDSFSDGVGRNTFSLATRTVSAVPDATEQYGSAAPLVTASVYDFSTGLIVSATDANGKVTTVQYNDPLDRPTLVTRPAGAGQTEFRYGDTPGDLYVRTLIALDASRETDSYKYFDGLGRPFRALQYENQDPAKPWLTVDTEYDALGRVKRISSPYRAAAGAPLFSTDKWTETAYDVLGRVRTVTSRPDNAVVTTSYSGNQVTVTDQAGKQSRTVTDALERITQVVEDPAGLAYLTNYMYDAAGNLRRVDQGGQLRYFMFDSLGRLVRAKLPEQAVNASLALSDGVTGNTQWSLAYTYDPYGNLSSRTDARGVTTNYSYDALNRNTVTSYQNDPAGTLTTIRKYDFAVNGRGRLYLVAQSGTATTATYFDEYDAAGRLRTQRQKFETNGVWSADYAVGRTYDLAGNVTAQSYPSGRTVSYTYDAAGRLASFAGNLGDSVQRSYAAGVVYDELGGVRQEQFGTDTPIYNKRFYNSRGQLAEIRVSTHSVTAPGQETNWNRGAILNTYSMLAGWTESREDNNGSLRKQMIFLPHDDAISSYTMLVQYYGYDSLGRLASVEDKLENTVQNFRQTYAYDRWGNRTINAAFTTNVPAPQFAVDASTNRLGVPAGYTGRMDYDAAGNLVNDSYTGYGSSDGTPTRSFDAEGRMVSARDAYGQTSTYVYDAAGKRVRRRVANGPEVWQVYGMDGELLAEYAAGAPPSSPQQEYGYRGGELLVTAARTTVTAVAPVNLAWGKAATQDSTLTNFSPSGDAWRAVDGDTNGNYFSGSVTHTAGSAPPWWQVDLGAVQSLGSIDLWNRTDCCSERLADFYVFVSDVPFTSADPAQTQAQPGVWSYHHAAQAAARTTLRVGRTGRYVRVQLASAGTILSLAEVQVWGTQNLGLGRETTQSSTLIYNPPGDSWRAVDGNTDGNYFSGSVTHTNGETQPWWQVDLGAVKALDRVEVWNRTDCCAERLTDFYVLVSDAPFASTDLSATLSQAGVSAYRTTGQAGRPTPVQVGRTGRYVRVQLAGAGVLSLAEVRVWGADSLMATQAVDVRWLVADQLGTPRMVLDKTGSLAGMTRHDYLPFGDEAPTGWGGRTPERGYVADNVRQKFTGYERDAETGLDYARARYYASSLGRFISPDPLMSSGKATAPQSWNRYAYCLNSPLDMADPDGLMWVYRDGGNGIWYLRWINGSLSASMQRRGWRAYQGPKRLQLANRNGFADLKNGYAEVWLGPNMQMKNTGQGYADMAAGLADSVPGANWVRHKVGILRYAREDSGEYQNTKVIATGVGAAKAAKGLAAAGAAAYHALKSLADDAAKAADDAAEMVYHGTTASETVTTKGLNLADNIAAAGGDDLANEGFSVTTRLDDARGFARGRSLLRGEDPVVLGARRADLDSVLHSRVPGITLDPGELRILRKDFKRVGPGVFRRIE